MTKYCATMSKEILKRMGRAAFFFFSFFHFLIIQTSCSDFLEVDVKGRATIPNFLSDPEGLRAGLVGAYNAMYDYYDGEFMKYPDVAGNMLSMRVTNGSMVNQYNYSSNQTQETETVGHIWTNIYDAQCNVNNIIQYSPSVIADNPAKADECRRYQGEAYLLRAMCHFDQCRSYAQPYTTPPTPAISVCPSCGRHPVPIRT